MFLTSFFDPGRPPGRSAGESSEPSRPSSSSSSPSSASHPGEASSSERVSSSFSFGDEPGRRGSSAAPWLDLQSQLRRQLQQQTPRSPCPPPPLPVSCCSSESSSFPQNASSASGRDDSSLQPLSKSDSVPGRPAGRSHQRGDSPCEQRMHANRNEQALHPQHSGREPLESSSQVHSEDGVSASVAAPQDGLGKDGEKRRDKRGEDATVRARTFFQGERDEKARQVCYEFASQTPQPVHAVTADDSRESQHASNTPRQVSVHPRRYPPAPPQLHVPDRRDAEPSFQTPSASDAEKNRRERHSSRAGSFSSSNTLKEVKDPVLSSYESDSFPPPQEHHPPGVRTPEQQKRTTSKASSFFSQDSDDDNQKKEEEQEEETGEVLLQLPVFAKTTERLIRAKELLAVKIPSRPSLEDLHALNVLPDSRRWSRNKGSLTEKIENVLRKHQRDRERYEQLHGLLLSSRSTMADEAEEFECFPPRLQGKEERRLKAESDTREDPSGTAALLCREKEHLGSSDDDLGELNGVSSGVSSQVPRESAEARSVSQSGPPPPSSSRALPVSSCEALLRQALAVLREELNDLAGGNARQDGAEAVSLDPSKPSRVASYSSSRLGVLDERTEEEEGGAGEERSRLCFQKDLLGAPEEGVADDDLMADTLQQASECLHAWVLEEQTQLEKLQNYEAGDGGDEEEEEESERRGRGGGEEEKEKEEESGDRRRGKGSNLLEEAKIHLRRIGSLKDALRHFHQDLLSPSWGSEAREEDVQEDKLRGGGEEEGDRRKQEKQAADRVEESRLLTEFFDELENLLLLEKKEEFLSQLIDLLQASETARAVLFSLTATADTMPATPPSLPASTSAYSEESSSLPSSSSSSPVAQKDMSAASDKRGGPPSSLFRAGGKDVLRRVNFFLFLVEWIADQVAGQVQHHRRLPAPPTFTSLRAAERLMFLVSHALPFFHKEISSRLKSLGWGRAIKRDQEDFFSNKGGGGEGEDTTGAERRGELADALENKREKENNNKNEHTKKKSVSFSSALASWSLLKKSKDKEDGQLVEDKEKTTGKSVKNQEDVQESSEADNDGSDADDYGKSFTDLYLYLGGLFLLQQIWRYFSGWQETLRQENPERKKKREEATGRSVPNAKKSSRTVDCGLDDEEWSGREKGVSERLRVVSGRGRDWRWNAKGGGGGGGGGGRLMTFLPPYEQIWSVQTLGESLVTAFNYHFCREGGGPLMRLDRPEWAKDFLLQQLERHEEILYDCRKGLGWIDPRDAERFSFLTSQIESYERFEKDQEKLFVSAGCSSSSSSSSVSSSPASFSSSKKDREMVKTGDDAEDQDRRQEGQEDRSGRSQEEEEEGRDLLHPASSSWQADVTVELEKRNALPPVTLYKAASDLSLCVDPVEGLQVILAIVFRQFLLLRMPVLIYAPVESPSSSSSSPSSAAVGEDSSPSFFNRALEHIALGGERSKPPQASPVAGAVPQGSRGQTLGDRQEDRTSTENVDPENLQDQSACTGKGKLSNVGGAREREERGLHDQEESPVLEFEIAPTNSGTAVLFLKHLEQALCLHNDWRNQNSLRAASEVMKDFSSNTLIYPPGWRGRRERQTEHGGEVRKEGSEGRKRNKKKTRAGQGNPNRSSRERGGEEEEGPGSDRRRKDEEEGDSSLNRTMSREHLRESGVSDISRVSKTEEFLGGLDGAKAPDEKEEKRGRRKGGGEEEGEESRRRSQTGRGGKRGGFSLLRGLVTAALLEEGEEVAEPWQKEKERREDGTAAGTTSCDVNLSETSGWEDDSFNAWLEEEDRTAEGRAEQKRLEKAGETEESGCESESEEEEEEEGRSSGQEEEKDQRCSSSPSSHRSGPVGVLDYWISLDRAFMMREIEALVGDQAVEKHRSLSTLLQHTPGRMQGSLERSNELVAGSLALFEAALPRAGSLSNDDALERFYQGVFGPALQRITETIKASWNSLDCLAQDPARCALLLESVTALCLYLDPTEETLEKTSLLQQSTEEADGDEAPDLGDTNALLLRTFFRRFLPSHVDALASMRGRMEEFVFVEVQEDVQASLPRLAKVPMPLDRALKLLASLTSTLHLELRKKLQSRCLLEMDRSVLSHVTAKMSSCSSSDVQQLYTLGENCMHTYEEARRLFSTPDASCVSVHPEDRLFQPSLSPSLHCCPSDPLPRTHAAGSMLLRGRENLLLPSSSSSPPELPSVDASTLREAVGSLERELAKKDGLSLKSEAGGDSAGAAGGGVVGFQFLHSLGSLATGRGRRAEGEQRREDRPRDGSREGVVEREEGGVCAAQREDEEGDGSGRRRRRSTLEREGYNPAMRFWGRVQDTAETYLGYRESSKENLPQDHLSEAEGEGLLEKKREQESITERKKKMTEAAETLAGLLGVSSHDSLTPHDLLALASLRLRYPGPGTSRS